MCLSGLNIIYIANIEKMASITNKHTHTPRPRERTEKKIDFKSINHSSPSKQQEPVNEKAIVNYQ